MPTNQTVASSGLNSVMSSVDARTNLAKQNELEIMYFTVGDSTTFYGVNVFKIKEVVRFNDYKLTTVIGAHPFVLGMINHRLGALPIVSLAKWLGEAEGNEKIIIVCQFNKINIGLSICGNNKIIRKSWSDLNQPPDFLNESHTVTSIVKVHDNDSSDNAFIQILDVENLLSIVSPESNILLGEDPEDVEFLSQMPLEDEGMNTKMILVAEDSKVAMMNVEKAFRIMGQTNYRCFPNGKELLDYVETIDPVVVGLVITDLEMPQVSGFIVIQELKKNEKTRDIPILVNSSMSDESNFIKAKEMGAQGFIPKTSTKELISLIREHFLSWRIGWILEKGCGFSRSLLYYLWDILDFWYADYFWFSRFRFYGIFSFRYYYIFESEFNCFINPFL